MKIELYKTRKYKHMVKSVTLVCLQAIKLHEYLHGKCLMFQKSAAHCDIYLIAPYFGNKLNNLRQISAQSGKASIVANWTSSDS